MGIGNPVSHPYIKNKLKPEFAQSEFVSWKASTESSFYSHSTSKPTILPHFPEYLSRDLCFFTTDLFSGDRFYDLGRALSREV